MNETNDKDKTYSFIQNKSSGFAFKPMISVPLPHSKPIGFNFLRESTEYKLKISGGSDGIPYGVYPRLILIWIITKI